MISVAIQGGAMRSIYCLGAIRALTESSYSDQITSMHVASAGCISGMVLANQLTQPGSITVSEMAEQLVSRLAGPQFIDQRRIRKVVDVDYLVQVTKEVTSVSAAALAEHGLVFEVALTDAMTASAAYINVAESSSDFQFYESLRATMAIPVLYPPKVRIEGRRYIDGGTADPLPVMRALRYEPEMVIAISSVPRGALGIALEGREANFIRYTPGISGAVRHLMLTKNPLADAVDGLLDLKSFCRIPLLRISPSNAALLGHRLETDKRKLLALEALGYQDALQALAALNET